MPGRSRSRRRSTRELLPGLIPIFALAACQAPAPPAPEPTRGVIVISLDTLAADHLGAYGYGRDTSPFLDSLAQRGTLFENAIVQYPSTLVSHVSMFTGLYPQEHGVLPFESKRLSPAIDTLPERFARHGFRTAGHTEGGYVSRDFGFERGFDEFVDANSTADTDVVDTLERGLAFLETLDAGERFFLFLHTYSIHDPYAPPEPYRSTFWPGEPPPRAFTSEGPHLSQVNGGLREVTPETVEYFRALYDGSIRYVDGVLERFFGELETMGLLGETTVVVTSDHGEEFLQHGKLAHEQIYPECLRVPLIVLHPRAGHGRRVAAPVQTIDLAPTLYELAAVPPPERLSGQSLVPYLTRPDRLLSRTAYAETLGTDRQRTLISAAGKTIHQLVETETMAENDGVWIARSATFDTTESTLRLSAASFHRPRTLSAEAGDAVTRVAIDTEWAPFTLELPGAGRRRVTLESSGCDSPRRVGPVDDPRCLGVKLRGVSLSRTELFDWRRDPAAGDDLSFREPGLRDRLAEALERTRHQRLADPEPTTISEETEAALRALGYLDD